jgi:hypothetical protein
MSTTPAPSVQSKRSVRRRLLSRAVTGLLLSVTVLAASGLEPLSFASAQSPLTTKVTTTATTSTTGELAGQSQSQSAQSQPQATTGTYTESAAAFAFLTKGLGLPLGTSRTLTGAKSANALALSVGAPKALVLNLPTGTTPPVGATATLTINTATNTETVTSASSSGMVSVTVAHASTTALVGGKDVSGTVTDHVSLFNATEVLTGAVTDANGKAAVSLAGTLPSPAAVARDVVLAKGATLTLVPTGGLAVVGTVALGPSGHAVVENVTGTVTDTARWSLNASSAAATTTTGASLLPGLQLAGTVGTVTDSSGTVRYDVRGTAKASWLVVPGVKIASGTVELSDRLPSKPMFAAPGVVDGTDWVAVTGTVSTTSSMTTLSSSGSVAFNLSAGAGLLNSDQSAAVTLATSPTKVVLTGTTLTGHLQLGRAAITGTVTGTGMVSVQPKGGKAVMADATVTVTDGGQLVVEFPLDLSLIGMGPAGSVGTVYWASLGVPSFPIGGGKTVTLPAGLSAANEASPTLTTTPAKGTTPTTTPANGTTPTTTNPSATTATTTPTSGTTSATASKTYTVSSAVLAFLKGLSVPLAASTLSGALGGDTLTVSLPAPTSLPFTLPAGIPAPIFGPTTVTSNVSTGTLTLDASASVGTATPVGATLHVVVMNASTTTLADSADLTATIALTGVPFFAGTTLGLQGSLSYAAGALSASLTGTLEADLPIATNVVLMQGALVTLDSGTGLSVSGTLEIGSGNDALDLVVAGSVKDLKNWSLSLSDPNAPMWQPVPSLTLTPTFTGSVTDTDGTVRFDLATTSVNDAAPLTWDAGAGASLSVTHLEVSDATPPSGVTCPAGMADGDVWVDLQGSFGYTPANLNLTAEGCIDLTAQTFTISTAATGMLLPGNALFNIDGAALMATGDVTKKTFNVTASATLQITALSNQPAFPVGASFGTDGVVVGAQLPDLSSLGFSGSGAVYIASEKIDNFDPTTLGGQGSPFDLPAGLSVTLDYQLPSNILAAFSQIGINLGTQAAVHSVATLSSAGFSVDLGFTFGSQANGLQVIDTNGTALFLNSFDIAITVGAQNVVTLSGSAYFEMPALIPGTVASQVEISVKGSFNFDSLTLSLGLSLSDWTNALGISGLDIGDFAGNLGITFETGIPTPSLSLSADNIVFPSAWATAIGMVPGTVISFDANINLDAPLLSFSIAGPAGQPALTPLAVASSDPNVVNSLVVNQASLILAPLGGVTAAGDIVAPGISVTFDAVIDNVPVHVDASVGLVPPSLDADVSVGSFSVGPVNVQNPMFFLHLNPTQPIQIGFSGGVSAGDYSLSAAVSLALGDTANGASISLSVTAGLPSWLEVSGMLSGSISGDGSGASVSASGSGYLTAGGGTLGPVSFSYNGSLSWSDVVNTFNQVAQFFNNAGTQVDQVVQILQNLGDNQQDIIDVLNSIGINPTAVVNAVTSVFGLINNNYDYIWVNPTALQTYVLDVSGGSQDPGASVIDYTWNGGYNQQWAIVPGAGGDQIINRGSGQCLTVENNSTQEGTPLIQFPCNGGSNQLWNIGTLNTYVHEGISSVSSGLNVDVAGASFYAGTTIDQWPYNGGSNQYFWLTPGTN